LGVGQAIEALRQYDFFDHIVGIMALVLDPVVFTFLPDENVQRFRHGSPKVAACIGQHHGPNRRVRKKQYHWHVFHAAP
jgi:hypothetical protein